MFFADRICWELLNRRGGGGSTPLATDMKKQAYKAFWTLGLWIVATTFAIMIFFPSADAWYVLAPIIFAFVLQTYFLYLSL